jgi:hypothetical protein
MVVVAVSAKENQIVSLYTAAAQRIGFPAEFGLEQSLRRALDWRVLQHD